MPATLTTDTKRRTNFGVALTEAMRVREITQAALGDLLGMRQNSISAWTTGQALPPDVETVFDLERALDLRPGQLSRHLGFRPAAKLSLVDAVVDDGQLDGSGQRALLATYKELVAAAKRRHPSAHKAKVAVRRSRVA